MNQKVLSLLESGQLKNDPKLPIWVYKTETVLVAGKRFLKVYLFNKEFCEKEIDLITLEHDGKDYPVYSFSVVSEFNDKNIVGTAFEIPVEDFNTDVTIKKEIVNGQVINSSDELVAYKNTQKPEENNYLQEKNANYKNISFTFPQVHDSWWQCSCGRIHSINDLDCQCRQTLFDIKKIIEFNFEENHIQDYLKAGINYDITKAFEDNITAFGESIQNKHNINGDKLIQRLNIEEERAKYDSLIAADNARKKEKEERRIAAEKRAKRNKKIALILTSITVVCVAFIFVLNNYIMPKIKYDKALSFIDLEDYESAYVLLKDLNYKDSEVILNNIRIEYAKKLLSKAEVGSIIYFGNYEQDNDLTNGKEDIEWLVLDKQDDKVLVISKYALDCQQYNTSDKNVTWETCTLRDWLNNTFINDAFSTLEQEIILTSSVSADENPNYDTNPGNATEDKIFLLSVVEADKCFASDEDRMCGATDYVIAQGVYTNTKYKVDEKPACPWWLRSPGFYQKHAAIVNSSGNIYEYGNYVSSSTAVRPALWINLD